MINDFTDQTAEDTITDLQQQITRLQIVTDRLQNVQRFGTGSSMPASTRSGINVPPVSNISAAIVNSTPGASNIRVSWLDPPNPNVDRYIVYVQNAITGQTQEIQVASVHTSPAVFWVHSDSAKSIQIIIQTVLTNGQAMAIPDCPATALALPDPGIVTSTGSVQIRPGVNSTTAIRLEKANGTAILTIDTTNNRLNLTGLPTSSAGLSAGDVWIDTGAANVLKIV